MKELIQSTRGFETSGNLARLAANEEDIHKKNPFRSFLRLEQTCTVSTLTSIYEVWLVSLV